MRCPRLVVLVLAFALAPAAQAQVVRQMSGTAQYRIGNALAIPKLDAGGVPQIAGAKVTLPGASSAATQVTGATITLPKSQLAFNTASGMVGRNSPVLIGNPRVFQVYTNLSVAFPANAITFPPNGRTGSNTLSWCPGRTPTLPTNPSCSAPASASPVTIPTCNKLSCPGPNQAPFLLNGLVRYTRTSGQLGGPAAARLGGTLNIALKLAPYQAGFIDGIPPTNPGIGLALGSYIQNWPGAPGPIHANVMYTSNGSIYDPGTQAPGAVTNNTSASFGGPLTEGTITVHVTMTIDGGYEFFTLVGHDNRNTMTGGGNVQLVGGGISARTASGVNANRVTLNLTVPEPSAIGGFAASLAVLGLCHRLVRRRSR